MNTSTVDGPKLSRWTRIRQMVRRVLTTPAFMKVTISRLWVFSVGWHPTDWTISPFTARAGRADIPFQLGVFAGPFSFVLTRLGIRSVPPRQPATPRVDQPAPPQEPIPSYLCVEMLIVARDKEQAVRIGRACSQAAKDNYLESQPHFATLVVHEVPEPLLDIQISNFRMITALKARSGGIQTDSPETAAKLETMLRNMDIRN